MGYLPPRLIGQVSAVAFPPQIRPPEPPARVFPCPDPCLESLWFQTGNDATLSSLSERENGPFAGLVWDLGAGMSAESVGIRLTL